MAWTRETNSALVNDAVILVGAFHPRNLIIYDGNLVTILADTTDSNKRKIYSYNQATGWSILYDPNWPESGYGYFKLAVIGSYLFIYYRYNVGSTDEIRIARYDGSGLTTVFAEEQANGFDFIAFGSHLFTVAYNPATTHPGVHYSVDNGNNWNIATLDANGINNFVVVNGVLYARALNADDWHEAVWSYDPSTHVFTEEVDLSDDNKWLSFVYHMNDYDTSLFFAEDRTSHVVSFATASFVWTATTKSDLQSRIASLENTKLCSDDSNNLVYFDGSDFSIVELNPTQDDASVLTYIKYDSLLWIWGKDADGYYYLYNRPFAFGALPTFTSTPVTSVIAGDTYTYNITTTGGSPSTLTATEKPAWLTLTDAGDGSGTLTGSTSSIGIYHLTLRIENAGGFTLQEFDVTVSNNPASGCLYYHFGAGLEGFTFTQHDPADGTISHDATDGYLNVGSILYHQNTNYPSLIPEFMGEKILDTDYCSDDTGVTATGKVFWKCTFTFTPSISGTDMSLNIRPKVRIKFNDGAYTTVGFDTYNITINDASDPVHVDTGWQELPFTFPVGIKFNRILLGADFAGQPSDDPLDFRYDDFQICDLGDVSNCPVIETGFKILSLSIPKSGLTYWTTLWNGTRLVAQARNIMSGLLQSEHDFGACTEVELEATKTLRALAVLDGLCYVYGRFDRGGIEHIAKTDDGGASWQTVENSWGTDLCSAGVSSPENNIIFVIRSDALYVIDTLTDTVTFLVSLPLEVTTDGNIDFLDGKLFIGANVLTIQNRVAVVLESPYNEVVNISNNLPLLPVNRIQGL